MENNGRDEIIDGMMNTFYQYLDDYNLRDIMGIIYDTYIESSEEDEVESLDVYFERKMKPMWNYVYDLQKQINKIHPLVSTDTSTFTSEQLEEWSNIRFDDPSQRT